MAVGVFDLRAWKPISKKPSPLAWYGKFVEIWNYSDSQFLRGCWCSPSALIYDPLPQNFSTASRLRIYPVGMAQRLEEAYKKVEAVPDLRGKMALDLNLTDRELFEKYALNDLFLDGNLHECFFYMYGHEALQIPDSWVQTMATFNADLIARVSLLDGSHLFLFVWQVSSYHVNIKMLCK